MNKLSTNYGFSLTELITTIAILGILLAIATLNFSSWTRKSQIEKQTKELYSDFNTVRSESIFRKMRHSIIMNTDGSGYVMKRYSSADEPTSAGTTLSTINSQFLLKDKDNANFISGNRTFMFDIRGLASDWNTIRVNPSDSGAVFDCVVVDTGRTNLGRMVGGACVQQ